MSIRLISAPWWVRWLAQAAIVALITGPAWALSQPQATVGMGWRWGLPLLITLSLVAGALMMAIYQPMRGAYLSRLGDLTSPQRVSAVRALRQGDIPADPTVLSAAVRVGALREALGARRGTRRQRAITIAVALLYAGIAAYDLAVGAVRAGIFWAVLSALFTGMALWTAHVVRRRRQRLPLLRAAAGSPPDDAPDPDEITALTTLTRRQVLLRVALVLVVILSLLAVMLVWGTPRRDCRAAGLMINDIAEHGDLADPRRIHPGGPPLQAYREWRSTIVDYTHELSAPDLAPQAEVVAAAAREAEAIVEEARSAPVDDPGRDRRQAAFQATIERMIDAENELISTCHLARN